MSQSRLCDPVGGAYRIAGPIVYRRGCVEPLAIHLRKQPVSVIEMGAYPTFGLYRRAVEISHSLSVFSMAWWTYPLLATSSFP